MDIINDYLNLPEMQFLIKYWYVFLAFLCIFIPVFVIIDSRTVGWRRSKNSKLVNSDFKMFPDEDER